MEVIMTISEWKKPYNIHEKKLMHPRNMASKTMWAWNGKVTRRLMLKQVIVKLPSGELVTRHIPQ